ncbi:MAG: protein jag [Clostridia bacterium]|nr:protein jag [Clostridia bacterium]
MIRVEASGKTIEEATEAAVLKAGVDRDLLTIEVVSVPKKTGFFGLKMSDAVVAVMYEEEKPEEKKEEIKEVKKEIKKEKPAAFPETRKERPREEKKAESPAEPVSGETAEKAKQVLLEMLSKMGVTCDIEVTENGRELILNIVGDDVGTVIGRRGETLDALQYLLSLCVNKGKEEYIKITLDAENYREKRERTLEKLANKLAAKVVENKRSVTLEAMNPNERRIIHAALQDYKGVTTTSIGSEPNRRVVISSTEYRRPPRQSRGRRGYRPRPSGSPSDEN